jgi:hypothetical protein
VNSAPEIIAFSNNLFYDGKLTPLHLPTHHERLAPSFMDVKIRSGVKDGTSNTKECDATMKMIKEFITSASHLSSPRTIGFISLMKSRAA